MNRLSDLRMLADVIEQGGFSATARLRGTSQSQVSKAISRLESALQMQLLHRAGGKTLATPQGDAFYERILPLLEGLEAAITDVSERSAQTFAPLRIATPATYGRLCIAPLLPEWFAAHPQSSIELLATDKRVDLLRDGIDIAIRIGGNDDPDTVVKLLGHAPIRVVGHRSYFERHGLPSHPNDLVSHNCLVYGKGGDSGKWTFETDQGPVTVPVRGTLRSDNVDILLTAAMAGQGIVGITDPTLRALGQETDMVAILKPFLKTKLPIKAAWLQRRYLPPMARVFVDFIRDRT